MYTKTSNGFIVRVSDGAFIPADPNNADYAAYLASNASAELDLNQAKTDQIRVLTQAYNGAIQASVGFTTAAGVMKYYQADLQSQDVLIKAVTGFNLVGGVPPDFYWKSEDNTHVAFTLDDLKGLYMAMLMQGNAAFLKLQTLKYEVGLKQVPEDVLLVTWD
jgi:hypothetical protein